MTRTGAALLFPGQGAQTPGMGRALVEGGCQSSLLQLAEEAAVPLERLLVSGTAEELRPTEVAQPALFYTGVALAELLVQRGLTPTAAAGHSLGEYCAVVAAGALTAADGMRLVLERGRLMGEARDGTMAAVLGLELTELEALCLQVEAAGECCVVANDNAPGQVVVSGSRAGVERLTELAKVAGARRVVQLNVGGAFHSPLMAPAAKAFASLLDQVPLREPRFPVAAGVTGTLSPTAAEIREGLREQLTGRVRWVEVVRTLAAAGAETFWECGPGTTLAGLGKRILPAAPTISVDTPEHAAEAMTETLSSERRSPWPGDA
ncbi:MAG TPA: ACP S-malonyltransferase [Candidatus Dormibacteraeota bacterium]|nr:ACP S-malonyltransferase [Candidatus Dormibacteraeota bacterium]